MLKKGSYELLISRECHDRAAHITSRERPKLGSKLATRPTTIRHSDDRCDIEVMVFFESREYSIGTIASADSHDIFAHKICIFHTKLL